MKRVYEKNQLNIINNALNETLELIPNFIERIGKSKNEVEVVLANLNQLIAAQEKEENIEINWTTDELVIIKNVLAELLKELATWEFFTRIGYAENDVFQVLCSVKKYLDFEK